MYHRILIPVDGSEHTSHAVRHAINIASFSNGYAVIHLVHAYERIPSLIGGEEREDLKHDIVDESHKMFQEHIDIFEQYMIENKIHIVEGDPETVINNICKKENCDIIIMGTRGLSGVQGALMGSVATKVIHNSSVPVLVIK